MKLTLERTDLLNALAHVQGVVERRNTIPILGFILVKAKGKEVTITATDMDLVITETLPAEVGKAGELTLPALTLYDIVRKLPDGAQVNIETSGTDRITLTSGRSRFTLASLPVADFPVAQATEFSHSFALPGGELKDLVEKTRFAISTEETRYYLNGIFLHVIEVDGTMMLRAVATDGHRLASTEITVPAGSENMPGVIIPRKAIENLRRLLEEEEAEVKIDLSENSIQFTIGELIMNSKLIDGTFPDYSRVIPENNEKIVSVERSVFSDAIDRVSVVSLEKTRAVRLSFKGDSLMLTSTNLENDSAVEELEAKYSSDPLEIGFNVRYLLDVTQQINSETIQLEMADPAAPVIVRGATDQGSLYVLMPMRV